MANESLLWSSGNSTQWSVYVCVLVLQSCLILCDHTDVAHQAPLSMEFSRKEYWSGLPFPSPVDLPDHKWWMSLQKSNFSGPGL